MYLSIYLSIIYHNLEGENQYGIKSRVNKGDGKCRVSVEYQLSLRLSFKILKWFCPKFLQLLLSNIIHLLKTYTFIHIKILSPTQTHTHTFALVACNTVIKNMEYDINQIHIQIQPFHMSVRQCASYLIPLNLNTLASNMGK